MRKVGFFALLTALASLSANADTVVTSKTYVDATRQAKITAGATGTVATYNGTDSNGGAIFSSKAVFSDTTASNYVDSTHSSYLPTMGAVMAQINGATASVLPSGSANQVLQYNGTTSAWESTTMDTTPTQSSVKPVTSGGVYSALQSAVGSIDGLPAGSANQVLQYNGTTSAWESTTMDTTPTQSSVKPVTSGGVYDAVNAKQDKLGGSGNGGKVVTATDTAGEVTYTTVNNAVDTSSNLITSGGVKTYVDSKISGDSAISSVSTTTAPNEKAVYDSINAVQSAVTTLQGCTHTCANTACTLIDINCVNS